MFRVTFNSLCCNSPVNPGRVSSEVSQLVTRFALGFDFNRPPEYITLYNLAMNHYDKDRFELARDNLREALRIAQEQNASELTIGLYKKELESMESFFKGAEKTNESIKKHHWWKGFFFGGFSIFSAMTVGCYTVLRLIPQGGAITRGAKTSL